MQRRRRLQTLFACLRLYAGHVNHFTESLFFYGNIRFVAKSQWNGSGSIFGVLLFFLLPTRICVFQSVTLLNYSFLVAASFISFSVLLGISFFVHDIHASYYYKSTFFLFFPSFFLKNVDGSKKSLFQSRTSSKHALVCHISSRRFSTQSQTPLGIYYSQVQIK